MPKPTGSNPSPPLIRTGSQAKAKGVSIDLEGGLKMGRVDAMATGMADLKPLSTVEIPSLEGKVAAEEWKIRVDLAAAYRLVAYYGWDDIIFTHLSARVPGPEHHFLLNPYNLMFEEVTASSLVKVGMDGLPVEPSPFITNPAGFTIHSAIHMARPDAQAVMHLHTPHGQAVSAHSEGLLPLTQTAMLIRDDVAYHDYEGVAVDLDERERLIVNIGDKGAMLLRNHGTLALGETVGEAFLKLYFLERACEAQILALSAGEAKLNNPPQGALSLERASAQIVMPAKAGISGRVRRHLVLRPQPSLG
jgi:ribulose-5-phosphate 4-epimerase/fuculose-1-phosphate aldolase